MIINQSSHYGQVVALGMLDYIIIWLLGIGLIKEKSIPFWVVNCMEHLSAGLGLPMAHCCVLFCVSTYVLYPGLDMVMRCGDRDLSLVISES